MKKLTPDQVRQEVSRIREMSGDDEAAHSAEDDLYQKVLAAIRDGECDEHAQCAGIALETQQIEFQRWCA